MEGRGEIPPGSEKSISFHPASLFWFSFANFFSVFFNSSSFITAILLFEKFSYLLVFLLFFFFLVSLCSAFVLDHVGGIYLAQISDEKRKKKDEYSQTECIIHRIPGNLVGRVFDSNQAAAVCFRVYLLSRFCPSHVSVLLFSYQC